MGTPARSSFAAAPPGAADVLRPGLPGLADDIIAAIAAEVPGYARAMSGRFGEIVRIGVEVALNRFFDLLLDPGADVTRARDTYVNLGRGEFHAGRSLDALLAAYRVGARLAWRRCAARGLGRARAGRGDRRGDRRACRTPARRRRGRRRGRRARLRVRPGPR